MARAVLGSAEWVCALSLFSGFQFLDLAFVSDFSRFSLSLRFLIVLSFSFIVLLTGLLFVFPSCRSSQAGFFLLIVVLVLGSLCGASLAIPFFSSPLLSYEFTDFKQPPHYIQIRRVHS